MSLNWLMDKLIMHFRRIFPAAFFEVFNSYATNRLSFALSILLVLDVFLLNISWITTNNLLHFICFTFISCLLPKGFGAQFRECVCENVFFSKVHRFIKLEDKYWDKQYFSLNNDCEFLFIVSSLSFGMILTGCSISVR